MCSIIDDGEAIVKKRRHLSGVSGIVKTGWERPSAKFVFATGSHASLSGLVG